jgi:NADH:ubiquinone oxidoreductase subunit H
MPATRSPFLTLVLAIVILAILTAVALAVMKWGQRRAAAEHQPVLFEIASSNVGAGFDRFSPAARTNSWKADYENVWQ